MGKFYDLTGQQFGLITVLEKAKSLTIGGKLRSAWKCRCECGVEKDIATFYLMRGSCKSCGCKEHVRYPIESMNIFHRFHTYMKNKAKRNKKEYTLSVDDLKDIILLDCHYCGAPPSNKFMQRLKGGNKFLTYSGLDRMDSTQGYIPGNCVPCCFICNSMKNNLSYPDFVKHISTLYKKLCNPYSL